MGTGRHGLALSDRNRRPIRSELCALDRRLRERIAWKQAGRGGPGTDRHVRVGEILFIEEVEGFALAEDLEAPDGILPTVPLTALSCSSLPFSVE